MQTIQYSDYLILALIITLWCLLHSAMISLTVTRYLKRCAPDKYRYYRLFFNCIALLTLIPVIWYTFSLQTEAVFDWHGYLRPVQVILIGTGVMLFFLGVRKYDARRFLGLSQLNETESSMGITQSGELNTSGILAVMRHPWYAGLLLILWARPMDISTLILNSVFSLYLFFGAYLEERKLLNEFGKNYRQYQHNVSMLLPVKWLLKKLHH
jgi:protein-S-isoprenylcysteine O-methyltransferase Ste14